MDGINNQFWDATASNWTTVQCDYKVRFEAYKRGHERLTGSVDSWLDQTTVQHVAGLTRLAHITLDDLRANAIDPRISTIDEALLMRTIQLHDRGEIKSEFGDVKFRDHKAHHERAEYYGLLEEIAELPQATNVADQRAFLLQFVHKQDVWSLLPDGAQLTLQALKETRSLEANLFAYLEYEDNLQYGANNQRKTGQPYVMTWILRNMIQRLDELVQREPLISHFWQSSRRLRYLTYMLENRKILDEDTVCKEKWKKPPVRISHKRSTQVS